MFANAAPVSTMMTNALEFTRCLWWSAFIGTLGIPGTPRDYMWAAQNPTPTIAASVDSLPPVLNLPGDMLIPCDPEQDCAVVHFEVSATDDQPGVSVLSSPRSGSVFRIGLNTVVVTALDAAGNLSQGSFNVIVTDSRPPVLNCPPDLTLAPEPGAAGRIVNFNVTATDNQPGVRVSTTPPSGSFFPLGRSLVLCTARDAAGNTASCAFTVNIADVEPPAILCPTNLVVVATPGQCGAQVTYRLTMDELGSGASLASDPSSGSWFPIGVSAVRCAATDAAGNIATKDFLVTVVDAEIPILDLPTDLTIDAASGETNAIVNYLVTASDNCEGVTVVCWPPSDTAFPVGTTTVIAQATDAFGNVTLGTFRVTVRSPGIEPPLITRIVPSRSVLPRTNGRLMPVALRVGAVGQSARVVSRRIIAVTCNEQERALETTSPDWIISGPMRLWLRAECHSAVNDRIYTIIVECKDAAGNVKTGTTEVRVRPAAR